MNHAPVTECAGQVVLTTAWRLSECPSRLGAIEVCGVSRRRAGRIIESVARHSWPILAFDDLVVGDEWESPRRTVTQADVVLFAGISGDYNPLHVDHHAAERGPFGRPVAHGL